MYRYLFLPFFLIPLVEVWILVKVGREIGAWSLIGLIILTAVLGVYFLRQQGLSTLLRAQQSLIEGHIPATEMVEGAQLLVAGALLLTPGFATDTLGFLLIWPATRRYLAKYLTAYVANTVQRNGTQSRAYSTTDNTTDNKGAAAPKGATESLNSSGKAGHSKPGSESSQTIEGEFTRED